MRNSSVDARKSWRQVAADGSVTLRVHAQPGAARTEVTGVHGDALKIRLAAPAIEGQANDALIAFLAASFGVARRNIALIRGQTGRSKTVRIDSPSLRPDYHWGQ